MASLSRLQWAIIVAGLGLVVAYVMVLSWAMRTQSYASWRTLIVFPAIVIINASLIWIASRVERDSIVTKLLIAGFLAKCLGVVCRYVSVFYIYGRVGDAARYNDFATVHYGAWRDGTIAWAETAGDPGTQLMELITTAVYVVVGPAPLAGFYVFGSMAFWGIYLTFRAFRIALPESRHRRYAALVFFLPSLLYWPSSIGKESWILLFVGVFAYGVARFFDGHPAGLLCVAVGIVGAAVIRPHSAVLLMAAAAIAQFLRPTDKSPEALVAKVIGLVVMVGALGYLIGSAADFLGVEAVSADSVTARIETAGENTEQGGSAFTPTPLATPLGVPTAFVTVLFRPFFWEAHSFLALLQSLEGIVLILLLVRAWPQLRHVPKLVRRNPYVTFAIAYCAGFVLAFSGFGNFAILARQRVLMLPFFLILLALPAVADARRRTRPRAGPELTNV